MGLGLLIYQVAAIVPLMEAELAPNYVKRSLRQPFVCRLILIVCTLMWGAPAWAVSDQMYITVMKVKDLANGGRYLEAEALAVKAVSEAERNLYRDKDDLSGALAILGQIFKETERYNEAEAVIKRALQVSEKIDGLNNKVSAIILNNLALIYTYQNRYSEAEPLAWRAYLVANEKWGPTSLITAQMLANLGFIKLELESVSEAEVYFNRALYIFSRPTKNPIDIEKRVQLGINFSNLLFKQKRFSETEKVLQTTLKVAQLPKPLEAVLLNNLAFTYSEQAAFIDKRISESKSKQEIKKLNKHLGEKLKNAVETYLRSLKVQEKLQGPKTSQLITTYNNLGNLYWSIKRPMDAIECYTRALKLDGKVMEAKSFGRSVSLRGLTTSYLDIGLNQKALHSLQLLAERGELDNMILLHDVRRLRDAKSITPTQSIEYAFNIIQAATKNSTGAATSNFVARFAHEKGELSNLIRKLQDMIAYLEREDKKLNAQFSEISDQKKGNIVEANLRHLYLQKTAELAKVKESVKKLFPRYANLISSEPIRIEDIQASLDTDEALVIIVPGNESISVNFTYGFVVTRTTATWSELDLSKVELEQYVKEILDGIRSGNLNTRISFNLYRDTLGHLEKGFLGKKRLSVFVTGALTRLPLQVLVTKDPAGKGFKNVDWLVKSYAITNYPTVASLNQLRTIRRSRATKQMVAFADPVYDRSPLLQKKSVPVISIAQRGITGFYKGEQADFVSIGRSLGRVPLPGTRREVLAVAKSVNADVKDLHFGLAASPATVKNIKLNDYRIVYFATHALVAGDIEKFTKAKAEPAIALTFPEKPKNDNNGLLFASDVTQLKMDADWTVLSACNTAAGDSTGAEALSGLARAFIYAGSRSLLVSHWQVDDTRTARLMTNLFNIAQASPALSHGEALQQAELRLLETAQKDEDANPRLWAPFVVIGEPAKNKPTARK